MLGVSFTELIVIGIIVLIVFGPEKLPELMHSVGVFLGKLQREYDGIRREFYNSVYTPAQETKDRFNATARDLISVGEQKKELSEEQRKEQDHEKR